MAKNLSKLKRRGYRLEDVLMVDDTPAKLANHYGNLVRVKPFFGDLADQVRIPRQAGHRFRRMSATHSGAWRPPIPRDAGRG